MCYKYDEELWDSQSIDECDQPDAFSVCDEFAYTMKRFGLVNRVERSFWGTNLAVLHKEGSAAAAIQRHEFFLPWEQDL